ncbi:hypothetical protein HK099_007537 [Clydaea vesicula]|uniref:Probable phenylalanine--tRNA ligase alpha subunit n=1 Tax=Clydaea vesicula TaxID=447962 RepID=A0AAD5U5C1_9FUNG|nr:hypothetical protein HK099_007537 [Clydaea vesicula]
MEETSIEKQQLILNLIEKETEINDSKDYTELNYKSLIKDLSSLTSRDYITYSPINVENWKPNDEGLGFIENGSLELRFYNAIPEEGVETGSLKNFFQETLGKEFAVGQAQAMKKKWVKKEGSKIMRVTGCSAVDEVTEDLKLLKNGKTLDKKKIDDLKKRKLIEKSVTTTYKLLKGTKFTTKLTKLETDLTQDLLKDDAWKTAEFKPYNFDALGAIPSCGHLHPLMKVRDEFRQIFFDMGFTEMPTNKFVESSFWNFDALFQPQQHPAREAHDTFFLKDPVTDRKYPKAYMEKVKKVHSVGDYESIGYGYTWSETEAEKLIMRTHTTAVSSNMLYQLAQEKEFRPAKYFSIDRVFRNETVDATHLAEFHQIEGLVADRNITLGDLIGMLKGFCRKLGLGNLRFKPAYNPYTEPSMEIFAYHDKLGKFVEIGNSGMFRPEMLLPLGLPPDVRVIAWGLGLERFTMIKYKIENIRDLLGHKVDLDKIKSNPITSNYIQKIQLNSLSKNNLSIFELQLPSGFFNETTQRNQNNFFFPAHLGLTDLKNISYPYFYKNDGLKSIVFFSPIAGFTTENSKSTRTELREVLPIGLWNVNYGTHYMKFRQRINHLPKKWPGVVYAQVHDGKYAIATFKAYPSVNYEKNGKVSLIAFTHVNTPRTINATLVEEYTIGETFEGEILVVQGTMHMLHNGEIKLSFPASYPTGNNFAYFKIGCYSQSNLEIEGNSTEYTETEVFSVTTGHFT